MKNLKKNNFIDGRVWTLAYAQSTHFKNGTYASGMSLTKYCDPKGEKTWEERKRWLSLLYRNELGLVKDKEHIRLLN